MIFNLNEVLPDKDHRGYDICIVGAGVAGITLALDLAARGRRVLLLEAGDIFLTDESQNIYIGENIGRPYFDLAASRLRYLGGTSNHWSGWCRPLDAWDFETHKHIPESGWPISKTELDRHLDHASQILEVPSDYPEYNVQGSDDMFSQIELQFSPPVRFSEKYQQALKDSTNIDLFLNANLVDIRLTEMNDRVTELHCANYTDSSLRYVFSGERYVLAMGGIENARMLLNFNSQMSTGIGNKHDLVGRYFMEHFHALGGHYVTQRDIWPFTDIKTYMAPSSEFMMKNKTANAGLRIGPITGPLPGLYNRLKKRVICDEDIILDFVRNFYDFWCPTQSFVGGFIQIACEQVPNRDSRVMLTDKMDRFGLKRVELDWQITDLDRHTIKQTIIALGRYFAVQKIGNIKLSNWLLDDNAPTPTPVPGVGEDEWHGAGWHHMGTTRMASTAEKGVVDKHCRVFGVNNLYIAGSSVFPTGGHANPTLSIVQLTLRLSEHLDSIRS